MTSTVRHHDAVVYARPESADHAALRLEFARQPHRRSVATSAAESNVPERKERLLARIPPAAPLPRIARWTALILTIPLVVFAASTTRAASVGETSTTASAPAAPPLPPGVSLTRPANPDDYYPAVAKEQIITGFAVVEVDVDVLGQLVDARVVQVEPADPKFGFADAALQVARNSRYSNTSPQVGTMKFKVRFDLQAPAANSAPATGAQTPVRITRIANPDDFYPRAFYPGAARREKVAGEAVVEVAVDPSGQVVNVAVSDVLPADPRYGFGRAAERVARANRYANPTEEVATIKFKVIFNVKR